MTHGHKADHLPPSGTGWAVCECGATARVEKATVIGPWHVCELCVPIAGKIPGIAGMEDRPVTHPLVSRCRVLETKP